MRPRFLAMSLAGAALFLLAPQTAWAQYSGRYMGRADNPVGPTVSPYLNLFRDDLDGSGDFNYQTLVRPMLQQQQYNQQAQRQSLEISRRLQAIAAQGDFNAAGSKDQYPTGHQTVFQYYGHHYPAMNAARPRR